jgi:membrane protease YdiL (CAAX protease family)
MKAIVVFTAITYALAIALSFLIGLTGGHESEFIDLAYLSMFVPAIAVLIVNLVFHEALRVQWDRFPLKWLPVALFLIPVILHAVMLPLMTAIYGGVPWQEWLKIQGNGLYHTPASRGWGTLNLQELIGRIVFNAVLGVIVVSFLALFEEIGWRAWLLPRLTGRMGARRAVVATSVLWAIWHVPFQFSGISYVRGVSPLNLVFTLPLGTVAAGLILGWIWLRTESIWLVSIAHGGLNNWGQYAFKYMKESTAPQTDLIVLAGGSLAMLVVGALLLWRDAAMLTFANTRTEE